MFQNIISARSIEDMALRLRGGRSQLRYLSQSTRIEEAVTPHIVRTTMLLVCGAVVLFVGWAAVTEISEVARTEGSVTPSGHVQVVQHLEGGIVQDIFVEEGDFVEDGEILLRLKGGGDKRDLDRLRAKQLYLEVQAERLRAFIENREPDFSGVTIDQATVIPEQQRIFEGAKSAYESERKVVETQLAQRRGLLSVLETRSETLEQSVALMKEAFERKKVLVDKGLISRLGFLEAEQRLVTARGERAEALIRLHQSRQEIAEYENRVASVEATYRDQALRDLEKTKSEMHQNREAVAKIEDRVALLAVRAPGRGYVKGMAIRTVGAVATPGETLMEIVPVGQKLVAEVRIHPKDIGHIGIGDPVQVKLSSYDFARYGAVEGVVDSLSATTFVDEKGSSYYVGRVALETDHVGNNPQENKIRPGMTVEADVITGGKSILAYLLKPIHTSLNSALRER